MLTLSACGGSANGTFPAERPAAAPQVARLLFQDSFNGTTLNMRKWFWCYPTGSSMDCTNNQTGIRYREREQYRPTQLIVSQGLLHLVDVGNGNDGRPIYHRDAASVLCVSLWICRDTRAASGRARILAGLLALACKWRVAAGDRRHGRARRAAAPRLHDRPFFDDEQEGRLDRRDVRRTEPHPWLSLIRNRLGAGNADLVPGRRQSLSSHGGTDRGARRKVSAHADVPALESRNRRMGKSAE